MAERFRRPRDNEDTPGIDNPNGARPTDHKNFVFFGFGPDEVLIKDGAHSFKICGRTGNVCYWGYPNRPSRTNSAEEATRGTTFHGTINRAMRGKGITSIRG